MRLLIGLENDYQGDIFLDGSRIDGTGLNRGIVFQEHRLFPWLTVEQNVSLGLLNAPGADAHTFPIGQFFDLRERQPIDVD